jgi:serine/threonine-protein kinase
MGVVTNFKIRNKIRTLLSSPDLNSPPVSEAVAYLKETRLVAIPKLIRTLDHDQAPAIIEVLAKLVTDDTIPLYMKEIIKEDSQCALHVAKILSATTSYNPNKLTEYISDKNVSNKYIIQIFLSHKDKLTPRAVETLLSNMDKDSRTSTLKLIEQIAHERIVPVLIPWARNDDWIIRQAIARILSRFPTPEGESTLIALLNDTHKSIRQAALEGLANSCHASYVGHICNLLRDNDLAVQYKAIETIIRINAPGTIPHLIEFLQDESEQIRRGAVEVMNALADSGSIKELLGVLRDKDWWVRVRAADALGKIGGSVVVESVLDLIHDEDPFIRRTAVEILNTTQDERSFQALVGVLDDEDWWVRERAVDALAQLGDSRAVPVLIPMLSKDIETSRLVIRALGKIGEQSALTPILEMLHVNDRSIVQEALQALIPLTREPQAAVVQKAVQELGQNANESICETVQATLKTLKQRWGDHIGGEQIAASIAQSRADHSQIYSSKEHQIAKTPTPSSSETSVQKQIIGSEADVESIDLNNMGPGDVLKGRYKIIRSVGKGAFGAALLVQDTAVKEHIVLKFLHPHLASTEQSVKRFVRELRYARRITHENVIRIYDFLTFGQSYAISMEYFESHSLSAYIQNGVRIAPRTAVKVIQAICSGMHAAHQVHVIHRDLKPGNILVNREGLLKVVDFGLASAAIDGDSRVTKTGAMVGTPAYMSPEQIRGEELNVRTDIYGLGVIMYEMFTGRLPYIGKDTVSVIYQHVQGKAIPPRELNPNISPEMEAIIVKAMAVDPSNRFESMLELRETLARIEVS